MKKNQRKTIKGILLIPLILLGIASMSSNVISTYRIKDVNNRAARILDEDIKRLDDLEDVQTLTKSVHQQLFSNVKLAYMAKDLEIDDVNYTKKLLKEAMQSVEENVAKKQQEEITPLQTQYTVLETGIEKVIASLKEAKIQEAASVLSGEIQEAVDSIQSISQKLIDGEREQINEKRESLYSVYMNARRINGLTFLVVVILLAWTFYCIFAYILKPILNMKTELNQIIGKIEAKEGDLTKRIAVSSEDEIAQLGMGLNLFLEKLQGILGMLKEHSGKMHQVSEEVFESVQHSNQNVSELSALTQELSATMEEVGSSSQVINEHTAHAHDQVVEFATRSEHINSYAVSMKERAERLEITANETMQQANEKIAQMLDVLHQAIEDSKSVEKVNTLTQDILSISSQTNLLALNASIEAARAGESGRGFAVVADEISQLADSSRETANHIQQVNQIVISAVNHLAQEASQLVEYLNESILKDFERFVQTGTQYKGDADFVEQEMKSFAVESKQLEGVMSEIANSIHSITSSIDEGVKGIVGAAGSTQVLSTDVEMIATRMEDNQEIAKALQEEVSVFSVI